MPLPGQAVLSLFDQSSLRVDANIEEKYLSQVSVGDEATIKLDAYPELRLKGWVVEILRATNSQFSLIPAEGVSGTYIKVSQRVPLRIAIYNPPDVLLAPGLSAKVRIHVGSNVHEGTSQVVHHE
jgi:multidrug resistance efflux pump